MRDLPNLTPLRFFLAIFVVLYHTPMFCKNRGFPFINDMAIFHKGEEAVYFFFSLSGYLIIKQLFIEKSSTNGINLTNFYFRRALRIFPLYIVVLTFGLIYYNYVLPKMGFAFQSNYELWEGILLSIFFLPNVFSRLYEPGGIIEVLWSIGIEEQFYLFIAPLILFIDKSKIIILLIAFTTLYFALYFSGLIPELSQFSMLYFYFTFSGFISILSSKIRLNIFVKALLLGLVIIYFSTNLFNFNNEIYTHLFSMLLFSFFLLSITENPIFTIKNRILIHLGKVSYGIYMFHSIIMQVIGFLYLKLELNINYHLKFILFNFLVIIFTIIIASISYRYFETFFIKKKLKFRSL